MTDAAEKLPKPSKEQIAAAGRYFDTIYSAGRLGVKVHRDSVAVSMAYQIINADKIKPIKPQPKVRRTAHG